MTTGCGQIPTCICTKVQFFPLNEYILADSAFSASPIVDPAWKKLLRAEMECLKKLFNKKLAKARIKKALLLKCWFQYLKGIQVRIGSPEDMIKIINYVMCCVILHNLVIHEPLPEAWQVEINALNGQVEEEEDEFEHLPENGTKGLCWLQIYDYMCYIFNENN